MKFRVSLLSMLWVAVMVLPCPGADQKPTYSNLIKAGNQQLYRQRKPDAALKTFNQALEIATSPSQRFRAHLSIGETYLHKHDTKNALKSFDVILQDPKAPPVITAQAHYGAARVWFQLKDYDKSNEHLDKILAVKKLPAWLATNAWYHKANTARIQKQYKASRQAAQHGLEVPKGSANIRCNLNLLIGHAYRSEKNYDQAIKTYADILKIKKAAVAIRSSAQYYLAYSYYESHQDNKAIDAFQTYFKDYPKHNPNENAWANYVLGLVQLRLKHFPQAKAQFQKVIDQTNAPKSARNAAKKQLASPALQKIKADS